ncbi:MAG: hypoxanthine phosphoribosyltransferase [Desulfobacterales bacterium]|nr:hypoxanthine phosphoribosyltransferase [Desulfobacterales bacterium]MBF0397046.1 hypoxanthine phosphoribosyltransferase [Desulfobacterales bacterium]
MPNLILCLSESDIKNKIELLAKKISSDYQNSEVILIGVLKGAVIFFSDLVRKLSIPVKFDFVCASSYGSNTFSSGKINIIKPITSNIYNKEVIIVEDIVDTGLTLGYLIDYIKSFEPKSIKICAFIDKKERREQNIIIDYIGVTIDSGFLVGYGLDCDEEYRALKEIFYLKT